MIFLMLRELIPLPQSHDDLCLQKKGYEQVGEKGPKGLGERGDVGTGLARGGWDLG